MTTFRFDEAFVGIVALGTIIFLAARLRRGLREGSLPVGRSRIVRDERPGAFRTLFALYCVAAAAMAFIGLDLLVGIR